MLPFMAIAQPYKAAAGFRAAYANGITYRHFLGEQVAAEMLVTTRSNGFQFGPLIEYEKMMNNNMHWFVGGGPRIAYYAQGNYYNRFGEYYKKDVFPMGLNVIAGLEYVLDRLPLAFSLDVKPYVEFVSPGSDYMDMALSLRYTFKN